MVKSGLQADWSQNYCVLPEPGLVVIVLLVLILQSLQSEGIEVSPAIST
jgi:hypothetical protein